MYLAPLNYDRFFKKVFSDTWIAKRFLEDFFEVDIEEIDLLPTKQKITDDATAVEFDYRCKIDGQYTIVDMQQWFKTDVVKRFYVYHALNTALQLETLPQKSFQIGDDKKKKNTPDYNHLAPVTTLIWMADDSMNFTEDFVSYILASEALVDFVKDEVLWQNSSVLELMNKRNEVMILQNNHTKNLDFLPKNRLIYAFQKNIVKNQKYKKYLAWFEFAEKSKDKDNTEADFAVFAKDEVFSEVIRRLKRESLQKDDFEYIDDYTKYSKEFAQHESSIADNAARQIKVEIAENCLRSGLSIEQTILLTKLNKWEVKDIAKRLGL
jgi:hypothetical protein